jgi:hypothetical protein
MNFFARYLPLALVVMVLRGFGQSQAAPQAPAQTQPALPKVEMPSDPAALISFARARNGLDLFGCGPFHFKITYEALDKDGSVRAAGTVEQFWVSPKEYKTIYSSPGFTQTEYGNDLGTFLTGDRGWPDVHSYLALWQLFSVPGAKALDGYSWSFEDRSVGGVQFKCISLSPKPAPIRTGQTLQPNPTSESPLEVDCLSAGAPVLRLRLWEEKLLTFFNQIAPFQGRFIARDIRVEQEGKPLLHVQVSVIESLVPVNNTLFLPPADAVPVPRRVHYQGIVSAGSSTHEVDPEYPARSSAKLEEPIIVRIIVSREGNVLDAQPIAGPSEFLSTAVNAALKWRFKPARLDGEAVEFERSLQLWAPRH